MKILIADEQLLVVIKKLTRFIKYFHSISAKYEIKKWLVYVMQNISILSVSAATTQIGTNSEISQSERFTKFSERSDQ